MGLVLLVLGIAISMFPAQEPYIESEAVTIAEWSLQQQTLAPQNTTFYGKMAEHGTWFQLNISSSDSVKVTVSLVQHAPGPTKVPIFEEMGISFKQTVLIYSTGMHYIDVVNENAFSVTLWGNVLVQQQQTETKYRTIYPYFIPGLLIMLGGTTTLLFGISKKPRKPSKPTSRHKKKIRS